MLNIYQHTISSPVSLKGIGLHTGLKSQITILPAEENHGIVFKRVDIKNNNLIKANYKNVSSAKLCTTLQNTYGVKVSTVEHLLAALYAFGIDNALIEVTNKEIPIMDGSAKDFAEVLRKTKILKQKEKRKYLRVIKRVELIDGGRKFSIEPKDSDLEVSFQLNYKNKIIGKQKNTINFQKDNLDDVLQSRTFCLFEDIENIKKIGLAQGGSLQNALVVKNDKILNEAGLRNKKEFVNHKILDLAGDFILSGYRILGKVNCYQGGHELTNMFLKKLFSSKSSFSILEPTNIIISKKHNSQESIKIAVNA